MYSGGLDSVGALYQLLTAEQYSEFHIHVHHMHLLNREDRAAAEKQAVASSLKAFRQLGLDRFDVSESAHDYRFMRHRFIWDMDLCAFMAANIALADARIVHVAMGRTATDVDSGGERFQQRMQRAQSIFGAVWELEPRGRPEYIFPVVEFSKRELWDMLPEPVRESAWSCRRPLYENGEARACGRCGTCRDIAAMKLQ